MNNGTRETRDETDSMWQSGKPTTLAQTATTGGQAAAAKAEQLQSTADMQKKENQHLNSDDLSDYEIENYMSLRCPIGK